MNIKESQIKTHLISEHKKNIIVSFPLRCVINVTFIQHLEGRMDDITLLSSVVMQFNGG